MSRKARVGITRDFFGRDGKHLETNPRISCLDEMPEALVNKEVWEKPEFQSKLKRFLASK